MKRFFKITLTVLAMLLTMLLSAAITLRIALHGHEVTIPDFAGLSVNEASAAALKTGVDLNIENRFYSTTVPAGRILSQAPAAGSTVRHGWQVRVTESLGPQQVTIPDVVGQPVREASLRLRQMSLDLGTLAHIDAPGDPDVVLAQTPPPNAGVDQPRVNLLLSSTSDSASAFVLPSFVGLSYAAANRLATNLGLRITVPGESAQPISAPPGAAPLVQPPPPAPPTGIVASQSPESGFRASRGDTVKLTLSHPAAPAPVASISTPAQH
jgi:beta-lactam-binding protein with PASTA domain